MLEHRIPYFRTLQRCHIYCDSKWNCVDLHEARICKLMTSLISWTCFKSERVCNNYDLTNARYRHYCQIHQSYHVIQPIQHTRSYTFTDWIDSFTGQLQIDWTWSFEQNPVCYCCCVQANWKGNNVEETNRLFTF